MASAAAPSTSDTIGIRRCHDYPNIFLSDLAASTDPDILAANNITSMVSILEEFIPAWESPAVTAHVPLNQHLLVPADSNPAIDMVPHFAPICDFIQDQIDQGRNVLIHCREGRHRVSAVLTAYQMRRENDTRPVSQWKGYYYFMALKAWVASDFDIWKRDASGRPVGAKTDAYEKYLNEHRCNSLKACGYEDEEPGLSILSVKDLRTANWEAGKAAMQRIDRSQTLKGKIARGNVMGLD